MESQSNTTIKVIGGIIAVGVLAGIASMTMKDKLPEVETTQTEAVDQNEPIATSTPVPPMPTVQGVMYTDGTYTATGAYTSPAGPEEISLSLVVKDGVVTDSTFSSHSNSSKSTQFQSQFKSGYKEQIVGKKLSEISVGKVSGSSLTGKGFMDALTKIKTQAQL